MNKLKAIAVAFLFVTAIVTASQEILVIQGIPKIYQGGTGATTASEARINLGLGPGEEDLRFPAIGINPPGAISDPSRDTTDGLLSFSGTVDNLIVMQVQMPHGWVAGSHICPHLHVINTAASIGTTTWTIEYTLADINGNFSSTWASETVNFVTSVATSTHSFWEFSDIPMTNLNRSAMGIFKITRKGSTDAYNQAVKLLEFDIHYTHYRFGD